MRTVGAAICVFGVCGACNLEAHRDTGGTDVAVGACGTVATINSDYVSTTVSAIDDKLTVASASLISSASAPAGASAALSGDVVFPHDPPSRELVLIDRYPNGVVSWLDARSGKVRAQLNVNTGFAANAHDYLEIDQRRAFLTRYFVNPSPGREAFDGGGDILVIDPSLPAVIGRIDLSEVGGPAPNPDRMTRIGDDAIVVLGRFGQGFGSAEDGLLAGIDVHSGAIVWQADIPGLANCGGLAVSPSRKRLAVACTGVFAEGSIRQSARSGVAIFDMSNRTPALLAKHRVPEDFGGQTVAPPLAFGSEEDVFGVVFGDLVSGRRDVAFKLDLRNSAVARIHESGAFTLGDILCPEKCERCLIADAGRRSLIPFHPRTGASLGEHVVVDSLTGLPPRYLSIVR